MPLTTYICPDKERVPIAECLEKCRLSQRCLTRTTLKVIADQERPWDGVPGVTQCLNGTVLEYLRITKPYAIAPKSRAFALLGTEHHSLMDKGGVGTGELHLKSDWIQGRPDLLEVDDGKLVLVDFKTYGSYRVGKVLGIVKAGRGFIRDIAQSNLDDESLQLNMYRLLVREALGLEVDRMVLQITVRDGGVQIAQQRGVTELMYMVEVPWLPDEQVMSFFRLKSQSLLDALVSDQPLLCTEDERWNGTRCASYCDVVEYCPLGGKV